MHSLLQQIRKTYRSAKRHGSPQVIRNAALLSGLQAISYLLPLIVIPYLFRTIGPDRFGLVSFAQAFLQYFMILTDYAFNISATRKVSLCKGNRKKIAVIFSSVMTAKLVLLLTSWVTLSLIVFHVPKFSHDWLLYVLGFGAIVGNALFPLWLFQGTETMKYIANVKILGEFAFATSILCLVHRPEDYLLIPVLNSVVFLITGMLGLSIVFWRLKLAFPTPTFRSVKRELKAGKDVFLSIMAINAYTSSRIFLIGLLTSNTITGFYTIAEKIAGIVQTFPLASFSQAIFPRLSQVFRRNRLKAFQLMQQVQMITVDLSLLTFPPIIYFAPQIMRLICGGDYPATVLTLRILMASVFFVSWNAFRVQFLLVCGKMRTYARIHITMAAIGLPLLIILIGFFSYVGAALATVIIEGGIFTLTYYSISKLRFR